MSATIKTMQKFTYQGQTGIRVDFGVRGSHYIICDNITGEIIATGEDWSTTPTEEEKALGVAMVKAAIANGYRQDKFFVRFGGLPTNGKSTNYSTGKFEKGVSVISASQNLIDGSIELDIYGSAPSWLWVMDRPLYEVSGKIIGAGSDGEPVLKNAKIVKEITDKVSL